MKISIAVLAVGAGAAMAQSLSDLPPCGQTCVSNMINIASQQFGCGVGDITCYCTNQDFGYGIRDCSNEACSSSDAASVIAFGVSYCQQALASAGTSATGSAVSILSSALSTASGASDASGAQSNAITTGAAASASSAAASITGSAASAASSLVASASSAVSSLQSEASSRLASASSRAASAASSLASQATAGTTGTTGATGGAPMMTAFPIAGAAGMAALLFI